MNENIIFRKTTDLTVQEKQQFRDLFLRVFGKEMNEKLFERKFLCTPKGYSYHGLMLCEGAIVGAFNAIPYLYSYFGQELTFGLSVDTMISADHRGGGRLLKMANLVYEQLASDGVAFIFGFPNEYFYAHEKRILGTRDIGELDYYILPRNIGAIIPKLRLLNCISRSCSRIVTCIPRMSRPTRDTRDKCNIVKVAGTEFDRHRYDESYGRIPLGQGATCTYKTYEEEGAIRTLYIIDVQPLNQATLGKALRQVYRTAADSVDVVMYVGKLPFRPAGLLKVPDSKKPQRIGMTGKILLSEIVNESVFDLENWSVNISNIDVR